MALSLLGVVAAYLIGAIPVGLLVSRLAGGVDIRRHGSGNIGATNVLRTLGPVAAVATLLGDIVKGYAATAVAAALGGGAPVWVGAGTVAAVVGNCWPVFLGFRGGKGVATGLGAFLRAAPLAVLPAAGLWLLVAAASRYVSLASIVACLGLVVAAWMLGYPPPVVVGAAAVTAVIVWRHQQNIQRLRAGTESRLGRRVKAA
ncbi:MAG TPA: glycerol-3-phosphate 1-O-acyltransferase PlsY [Methylomirabilota bacterium]|nr:glycerol-3-phosphate 1-O-acyltransferase PlsY [Methylomirabilota bacterium]